MKKEQAKSENVKEIQRILDSPDANDADKASVSPAAAPEGGIATTARISVKVTPVPRKRPIKEPREPKTESSSNITQASDKVVVYVDKMLVNKHNRLLMEYLVLKLENVNFIFCEYNQAFLPKNAQKMISEEYNKQISIIKPSTNVFRITTKEEYTNLNDEEKKYTISYEKFPRWKHSQFVKVMKEFTG